MSITVLSCGIDELPDARSAALIAAANVVYGSRRLLERFAVPEAKRRVLAANARADAESLLRRTDGDILVLASGDALFHGMGGTLARLAAIMNPAPELHFLPGVTAFQALFARLGLPWDEAELYSAHHGDTLSLQRVAAAKLAVVYGGSRQSAAGLAQALMAVHPPAATRAAVLADSLGTPQEHMVQAKLGDIAKLQPSPTSILVVLPDDTAPPVLPLGLPVNHFEREAGLITAPDVRAVILSRLRLPAWGCLWDMGAGSGSVGLEAAGLCPGLDVWAVERKPERAAMARANAVRLGVANHHILCGESAAVARDLPDPDRIFFGGGGVEDLHALLDLGWNRLKPGGVLVLSAVTLETQHSAYGWHPERRTALVSVAVAEERPLAGRYHHLEPQRPIHLYCYCKPEPSTC